MQKHVILYFIILFSFLSCSLFNLNDESWNTVDYSDFSRDLLNDMFLRHTGTPAGVPNYYGWKTRPYVETGINVPENWNTILPWGQVYADQSQPNPDKTFPNARVHIKDLQLYIYLKNNTWKLIQSDRNPEGAAYVEDYANDTHKKADIRRENGGGISVKAGSGFNFHFWSASGRKAFDRNNIKGVFVICKARLIGFEKYDTLPKYLVNVGGDYWRNQTVVWTPGIVNTVCIGIGRFKHVTPEWQYFIMHTFSQEEVNRIVFPVEQ